MLLIFFGYIFIVFHFMFNGFDLLADFIGYFLVYMGLSKFPEVKNFVTAKPLALGMAVINFIYSVGSTFLPDAVLTFLNVMSLLLFVYIVYLVVNGIKELEYDNHVYLKGDKLLSLWRLMLIFTLGSAILSLLSGDVFVVMSQMFGITSTITNIIFLFHLISVKEGLEHKKDEN